ncbi:hypothetical protein HID58_005182 [Brassica napus]|uniref:Uncharacterized protein n=1 Tax=Brassica napus TaxID=3708 RepID=A0ABQ8E7Y2_BRANA|nr:hypothetical protein HID58_005182 [Brassica napus]
MGQDLIKRVGLKPNSEPIQASPSTETQRAFSHLDALQLRPPYTVFRSSATTVFIKASLPLRPGSAMILTDSSGIQLILARKNRSNFGGLMQIWFKHTV